MGNKKVQYILCVLFIITFILGVVGYLNKDKVTPNTPVDNTPVDTPADKSIDELSYNGNENILDSIDSIIQNYEFVKANKTFSNGRIYANIEDNSIVISVDDETGTNTQTYIVDSINNPVGILAELGPGDGDPIFVYVINSSNKLYSIKFRSSETMHDGIHITEYVINNIESFTIDKNPLNDNPDAVDPFVIIKASDGYYTDYKFVGETVVITKIGNPTAVNNISESIPEEIEAPVEQTVETTENLDN